MTYPDRTRRGFFAAIIGLSSATVGAQALRICDPCEENHRPYTRSAAYCPSCGDAMMVVRNSERPRHDAPLHWSCGRCRKSWSVEPERLMSMPVPYDDGMRR